MQAGYQHETDGARVRPIMYRKPCKRKKLVTLSRHNTYMQGGCGSCPALFFISGNESMIAGNKFN
jgi:hypothetical protein